MVEGVETVTRGCKGEKGKVLAEMYVDLLLHKGRVLDRHKVGIIQDATCSPFTDG